MSLMINYKVMYRLDLYLFYLLVCRCTSSYRDVKFGVIVDFRGKYATSVYSLRKQNNCMSVTHNTYFASSLHSNRMIAVCNLL
jgi:hypothetical protein